MYYICRSITINFILYFYVFLFRMGGEYNSILLWGHTVKMREDRIDLIQFNWIKIKMYIISSFVFIGRSIWHGYLLPRFGFKYIKSMIKKVHIVSTHAMWVCMCMSVSVWKKELSNKEMKWNKLQSPCNTAILSMIIDFVSHRLL